MELEEKKVYNYYIRTASVSGGHYIEADTVIKNGTIAEFILKGLTVAYYTNIVSFNIVNQ